MSRRATSSLFIFFLLLLKSLMAPGPVAFQVSGVLGLLGFTLGDGCLFVSQIKLPDKRREVK